MIVVVAVLDVALVVGLLSILPFLFTFFIYLIVFVFVFFPFLLISDDGKNVERSKSIK